jgi:hypothetical protein
MRLFRSGLIQGLNFGLIEALTLGLIEGLNWGLIEALYFARARGLGISSFHGNQECLGDPPVQRRKNCAVRSGELRQMAVRCLSCGLDPTGKMGDVLAVRNKRKGHRSCCLKPLQQVASLPNGKSVLWRLREDSDET